MKKVLICAILMCFQITSAQESEVRQAVEDFFVAFHAQDTLKLRQTMAKEMVLHSVTETPSGNRVTTETVDSFLKSIASIPAGLKLEERLLDFQIKIDGGMAHAWTPYEFYINGKLSHKGVNSFQFYHDGNKWKMIYIIDTRRK